MRQQRMQPAVAPRFAEMDEVEQERMRQRVRARARDDQKIASRQRAKAARSRGNVARDLTDTADNLSGSLNGVVGSLIGAFHGFRSVAISRRPPIRFPAFCVVIGQTIRVMPPRHGPLPRIVPTACEKASSRARLSKQPTRKPNA